VICLLEFVRDLPRTEANIAAFLIDKVGDPRPVAQVEAAIKKLYDAQFIRKTEDGWKLQTAQEKNWETEKKSLDPKPRDRNEIVRNALRSTFGEPALRTYRHKEFRTFRIGISVDGTTVGDEGDIKLSLAMAEDDSELSNRINEIRDESRQKSHENDLYWVFSLAPEIDELVAQLFASRKMVEKYDQLGAQSKITPDEVTCLQDEKNFVLNYESRLKDKVTEAIERGTGMFRGVARDASSLGKTLSEIIKKFLEHIVPDLYPKLEMGSRPLHGDEPDVFLKAADLKALPQVFYVGEHGLGWSPRRVQSTCRTQAPMWPKRSVITSSASTSMATGTLALVRRSRTDSTALPTDGNGTCCDWSSLFFSVQASSRFPSAVRNSTRLPIREAGSPSSITRSSSRRSSPRSNRSISRPLPRRFRAMRV